MKVTETVRDILGLSTIRDNVLFLPSELERKDYDAVNKVLKALGGKWDRKAGGHVFEKNPEDAIGGVILEGNYVDMKKELQFYETPEELAVKLCDMAEITPDCTVLEPSVGSGRIADEIAKRNPAKLLCIDINTELFNILHGKPYLVVYDDFLKVNQDTYRTHRIVMNPPFAKHQDIDHVLHAFDMLLPGGILVAVMMRSFTFRTDRKSTEFREFLEKHNAEITELPQDTFKESGANVNCCIVKIKKKIPDGFCECNSGKYRWRDVACIGETYIKIDEPVVMLEDGTFDCAPIFEKLEDRYGVEAELSTFTKDGFPEEVIKRFWKDNEPLGGYCAVCGGEM